MDYYKEEQYLAAVDKSGDVIGKVERWKAHREGILHSGYVVCCLLNGEILMQHRKHILFDGVLDFSCSSHRVYHKDKLETNKESILQTMRREWVFHKLEAKDISGMKDIGNFYYKAQDQHSDFIEHEICDVFVVSISELPSPNSEYAYGYSLLPMEKLSDESLPFHKALSPWAAESIGLLQRHLR